MNTLKYIFILLLVVACKNDTKTEIVNVDNTATEANEITYSNNLQLLQGSWQNTVDSLSIIKIDGNKIINFYSGKSAGPGAKISLSDNCLENPDPERTLEEDRYISIIGAYSDCYYITKLDKENLQLNFLNGGFDLTFKRI